MLERTVMMDESVDIFRQTARRFFEDHAPDDRIEAWRESGVVDRNLWQEAGKLGLLCPSVDEAYGGAGGDFRHELVVLEEMGRRGLEGFGVAVHSGIVSPYLCELGTDEQRERWLPDVISGETVLAIAMTEPGAGSDLKGIRTTAKRDGDHYIISGQKTFISNGQSADLIVVACKTGEDNGRSLLSLIVVEAEKADGFRRGRNLKKMGREAQDTSELFFDEVRVPVDNLLGKEGGGFRELTRFLPQERLVIAAMGLAMMERAIAETLDYVQTREAFGQTLFDFQNTQFKLAECETQATVARVLLDRCVEAHLEGKLDAIAAAKAKLWITETQCRVIDDCLQLFGGWGYMDEYPISRLYRDARIDRIHGGASEIMKLIIARSLARKG